MALPSSGNSISFGQINDELGNSTNDTLDLETAAETGFGLSKPHGLNEMFGLSLSRLEIVVRYMKLLVQEGEDTGETQYVGWSDGDLDDCAGLDGSVEDDLTSIESETDFNEDGSVSNGDVIFASSTGTTKPKYASGNSDELQGDAYLVETTQNNIFLYDVSESDISNVRSRTPNIPTKPTLVANSSTQITVTIPTTNTQVTKTFKIQRSINGASFSDLATITPSAKGNFANTSVNTTHVDSSGISAGDVVKYQVRGQNDFTNSDFSQESSTVTTPSGTSWGSFTNYSMLLGSGTNQTLESSEKSLTLTNGSGNTTITVEQPNNSSPNPDLEIKVGDSTGDYDLVTSYTETPSAIGARTTYFFKTKLTQKGSKNNSSETCDIVFTNNGVQKTITLTVEIGGLGGP